jgi:hypothetical protein
MSNSVKAQLTKLFEQAEELQLEERKDPGRFFFMRPSGFPYCGLRKLLDAPAFLDEGRYMGLAGAYFTSVGTAAHSAFQKYIGRLGTMIGDWRCSRCNQIEKFSTFSMCPTCKIPREYDELEIYYRNTVVGHTDGLLRLNEKKKGKPVYYVVDYKTSAFYKTSKTEKSKAKIFPLRSNVAQIKMYIVLLEAMYNINVEGYALAYLGRDLPLGKRGRHLVVVKLTDAEKKTCRKKLDQWVKLHRKVLKATTPAETVVIQKYKLCASHRDYMDNVLDEYNPCPIAPVCFNQKLLDKKIEKTLKHKVFPIINQAPERIRKILERRDE